MTFELPAQGSWTAGDMAVLPEELRYELIDGWVDIQDRAPLSSLAGLAVMGALKAGCPSDLRVVARHQVLPADRAAPAVAVLDEAGVLLAVDVVQPGWTFADMLDRSRLLATAGVSHYWVVESIRWRGLVLTALGAAGDGGFRVLSSTGEVFTAQLPYPVAVDLPAMSTGWPAASAFSVRRAGGPFSVVSSI